MTNDEFIQGIALPGEEWRDVVGYEGLYKVSSYGRIASISTEYSQIQFGEMCVRQHERKIISSYIPKKSPYFRVSLSRDGKKKSYLVHRLVAASFLPNPLNHPYVDHIDDVSTNNAASNLQWCTASFNNSKKHHRETSSVSHAGRIDEKRIPIVQLHEGKLIKKFNSIHEAGLSGFTRSSIQAVLKGKLHKHRSCEWMYLSDYESLVSKSKN